MTRRCCRYLAPLLAAMLLLGASALASRPMADDTATTPKSPSYFLFATSAPRDKFVDAFVREVKRYDLAGDGLDAADVKAAEEVAIAQRRARIFKRLMASDLNGDGVVTSAEAETVVRGENPGPVYYPDPEMMYYNVLRFDENGDGQVSAAEFFQRTRDNIHVAETFRFSAMLELDPDGDGKLTAAEMAKVTEEIFRFSDADHNQDLDRTEQERLRTAAMLDRLIGPCRMEKAAPENLLVHLYIKTPAWQPDISVAGQFGETALARLKITAGGQPLHLIAYADKPTIWQFEGAVERLAQVTILPPPHGRTLQPNVSHPTYTPVLPNYIDGRQAGAGVIGLAPDHVTFLAPGSCSLASTQAVDSLDRAAESEALERAFLRGPGRLPALTLIDAAPPESPVEIVLPTGDMLPPPAPLGEEDQVGSELRALENARADQRALVALDPALVLAPGPVEPYKTLPAYFGLRQLVEQGMLARTDFGYLIREPVTYFPAGLRKTDFILPGGGQMKAGPWMYPILPIAFYE